jgi:hypothetical protein
MRSSRFLRYDHLTFSDTFGRKGRCMRTATPGFILFAVVTIACTAPAAAQTTPATWSGPYVGWHAAP